MSTTLGRYIIFVILLLAFYDVFYAVVNQLAWSINQTAVTAGQTINQSLRTIEQVLNQTNATEIRGPTFSNTRRVLETIFNWQVGVLTNVVALAILLFLTLMNEAMTSRWR